MHDLPPIEVWWPPLSIEFKHQILRDLDAPLSAAALEEIRKRGVEADRPAGADDGYDIIKLSPPERGFILTQVEPVD